jgi:hypothetical protein
MANICSNSITISGDSIQLNQLRKKIKKQDKSLLKEVYFLEHVGYEDYGLYQKPIEISNKGDLQLDFTSKWSPPERALQKLSILYPLLSIEVQYEEPAMEVYGTLKYLGGQCIIDTPMDQESYLSEYNEGYNELVSDIEESKYQDFTSRYLDTMEDLQDDSETCMYPDLIERKILKRLKDKDLPLLVGYEWISKANQTEYENRIKGVKTHD